MGGVTRYSNLSFFGIFELILLQAAVTRKSVHALVRQRVLYRYRGPKGFQKGVNEASIFLTK